MGDMGDVKVDCPDYPHAESWATPVYVRPHELDIDFVSQGPSSLRGRVLHIYPAGSTVKVHVAAEGLGTDIQVDVAPDKFAQLRLQIGADVFVSPRRVRVFLPDYAI
jgi:sulfate/thiosulfate transport system ATP-binding protein